MSIFEKKQAREAILERLAQGPKGGRGQFRRLAEALDVSTTLISQIFQGEKHFSQEQAMAVCELLGFTDLESEYLLSLTQWERAGTPTLKSHLEKRLVALRRESQRIAGRIKKDIDLSDKNRQTYYSAWYYSAIRLIISLPGFDSVDAIAAHFGLSIKRTREVLQFLIESGLVLEKNGKLSFGPPSTYLEPDSPLVNRHHSNWRIKGMEKMDAYLPSDFFYTAPLTISREHAQAFQRRLADLIVELTDKVAVSDSEAFYCFNIDWFEVKR